jgi:hypothetical protein
MTKPVTLGDHVKHYAQTGQGLFLPVHPRTKAPLTGNGFYDATDNVEHLDMQWSRTPDALIGYRYPTTEFGTDVDPRQGGVDSYMLLQETFGKLPKTRRHYSGGADHGWHDDYLWPYPDLRPNVGALRNWFRSQGIEQPGIDILHHELRYSIWPPSPHPDTGEPYRWADPLHPIVEAPDWYVELLTEPEPEEPSEPARPRINLAGNGRSDTPAQWFTDNTTWEELLEGDGWTPHSDGERWTRPGKDPSEGISATVTHDYLFNYSETTGLPVTAGGDPHGLTRFAYYAHTRHGGDQSAAAKAVTEMGAYPNPQAKVDDWIRRLEAAAERIEAAAGTEPSPNPFIAALIDWPAMWANEDVGHDWLVEPVLARGRAHALYAPAKAGKSLLALEIAASVASGRAAFHQGTAEPRNVLYCDFEMSETDVRERLENYGYGPDDNLDGFRYALLPASAPLDTAAGGEALVEAARLVEAELVVIDTLSRVLDGEENSADTLRAFYQHTGRPLKAAKVTLLRVDHAGKNLEKGARGTSAKNDDVDVVWQLTRRTDAELTLKATHRRFTWVPELVTLTIREDPLRHQLAPKTFRYHGPTVEALDDMGIDPEMGWKQASDRLKEYAEATGHVVRTGQQKVQAAQEFRRIRLINQYVESIEET